MRDIFFSVNYILLSLENHIILEKTHRMVIFGCEIPQKYFLPDTFHFVVYSIAWKHESNPVIDSRNILLSGISIDNPHAEARHGILNLSLFIRCSYFLDQLPN